MRRTVLVEGGAKRELGCGEPFNDEHGSTADWASSRVNESDVWTVTPAWLCFL